MNELNIKSAAEKSKIIQITDTHINADPEFLFSDINPSQSLSHTIDCILDNESPDLVLVTGDLVHDAETAAYERLFQQLERFPVPVCCIPGNHDEPALLEQACRDSNIFIKQKVETEYWQVLLMNSFVAGTHAGDLPENELQRLKQQLETDNKPVLIAVHHHPVNIGSEWMDGMKLRNGDEFLQLISGFERVKGVICGHIHQEFQHQYDNVMIWGCPSTCVQFSPESIEYQQDSQKPGYRRLELLKNGQINTQVLRVSH